MRDPKRQGTAPTHRELQVLRHLANGETHGEAAKSLGIKGQTAKNLMTQLRQRIGALSTSHAIALMDDYQPDWRDPARPVAVPVRGMHLPLPSG